MNPDLGREAGGVVACRPVHAEVHAYGNLADNQ